MKTSNITVDRTIKLGHDLTAAFFGGLKDYTLKNNTDHIPLDVVELHVKMFINADKKNEHKLKGNERAAFNKLAEWKAGILKQILKNSREYAARKETTTVPIYVVETLIGMIDERIAK